MVVTQSINLLWMVSLTVTWFSEGSVWSMTAAAFSVGVVVDATTSRGSIAVAAPSEEVYVAYTQNSSGYH